MQKIDPQKLFKQREKDRIKKKAAKQKEKAKEEKAKEAETKKIEAKAKKANKIQVKGLRSNNNNSSSDSNSVSSSSTPPPPPPPSQSQSPPLQPLPLPSNLDLYSDLDDSDGYESISEKNINAANWIRPKPGLNETETEPQSNNENNVWKEVQNNHARNVNETKMVKKANEETRKRIEKEREAVAEKRLLLARKQIQAQQKIDTEKQRQKQNADAEKRRSINQRRLEENEKRDKSYGSKENAIYNNDQDNIADYFENIYEGADNNESMTPEVNYDNNESMTPEVNNNRNGESSSYQRSVAKNTLRKSSSKSSIDVDNVLPEVNNNRNGESSSYRTSVAKNTLRKSSSPKIIQKKTMKNRKKIPQRNRIVNPIQNQVNRYRPQQRQQQQQQRQQQQQPRINNAALVRKVDNNLFKANITLHKLINEPHKSDRVVSKGIEKTKKMRIDALVNTEKKIKDRGFAQIERFVVYNINEVTRITIALFKSKMHDIIYSKLLNPEDFAQNEDVAVPFQDMPSLNVNRDFYYPNYYDVTEVYHLCENENSLQHFLKSPISKDNVGDRHERIIKKYLKGKRYNYNTESFLNVATPSYIAKLIQSDYDKTIELIKEEYNQDSESKYTPSLHYAYSLCSSMYVSDELVVNDELDIIILAMMERRPFHQIIQTTNQLIQSMKFENWYDYKTNILEGYLSLVTDITNNNKYQHIFLIANRIYITHFVNRMRKFSRLRLLCRSPETLLSTISTLIKQFIKYKYLFFGEDYTINRGFVQSNRPLMKYCSSAHGKDVIIGYLIYKYCYDEAIKDAERNVNINI